MSKWFPVSLFVQKRWCMAHYFVTPLNGVFGFSSKDFQPRPVSVLWAGTFGCFGCHTNGSAWLLVLGSKKSVITAASCFARLPVSNQTIWRQCISSQWSSNSFHVTHQESLLVSPRPHPHPNFSMTLVLSTFYVSSIFLRPLQLQHEKAELEQHLEQEQEFQVNKLMKKIKKMENETISKQLTLEQVRHISCRIAVRRKPETRNTISLFCPARHEFQIFLWSVAWSGMFEPHHISHSALLLTRCFFGWSIHWWLSHHMIIPTYIYTEIHTGRSPNEILCPNLNHLVSLFGNVAFNQPTKQPVL